MPLMAKVPDAVIESPVQVLEKGQKMGRKERDSGYEDFDEGSTDMDSDMEESIVQQSRSERSIQPALPQRSDKRASQNLDNMMFDLEKINRALKEDVQQDEDPHEYYLSSEEDASLSGFEDLDSHYEDSVLLKQARTITITLVTSSQILQITIPAPSSRRTQPQPQTITTSYIPPSPTTTQPPSSPFTRPPTRMANKLTTLVKNSFLTSDPFASAASPIERTPTRTPTPTSFPVPLPRARKASLPNLPSILLSRPATNKRDSLNLSLIREMEQSREYTESREYKERIMIQRAGNVQEKEREKHKDVVVAAGEVRKGSISGGGYMRGFGFGLGRKRSVKGR